MLKKCFGIPSWLPDQEPARSQRIERVNRLFTQLNNLWPDIDILVIAQNWKDFKPIKTKNEQIIKKYEPLGILKARQTLREEFLKLDYDYIIMFDDDAIIKCDTDMAHKDYMIEVDNHPNGFCFIHGTNSKYHPYIGAQLNLCAISKFIYEKEPLVELDPQNNEGYEDSVYACLLHHKYTKYEFIPPKTIRPIQFMAKNEVAPSTWSNVKRPVAHMQKNTNILQEYIIKHKGLPKDYRKLIDTEWEWPDYRTGWEKPNTYLYF